MEPNKFDNIFKEKLEQRTIQPREMAWDRLDAMLSVAEEKAAKPKKKNRTWMYMAASFLGFLLVGTIFLKQGNDSSTPVKNNDVQIAVTPEPAVKQDNTNTVTPHQEVTTPDEIQIETAVAVAPVKVKRNTIAPKAVKSRVTVTPEPMVMQEAVAQNTNTEILNKALATEDPTLAVAEIDESEKSAVKVNAKSLLSSVEGELDNSFRNKAMQTLVKNYNTVKTSVANRNHK